MLSFDIFITAVYDIDPIFFSLKNDKHGQNHFYLLCLS